jgi:(2Fe-2S) ferredoxin
LAALEKNLGIKAGTTTEDNKFSLEAIRCVGACALGPMVLVNDRPYSKMTPAKAQELLGQIRSGELEEPAEAIAIDMEPPAPVDLSAVPPAG